MTASPTGLEGVIAGKTAICTVGREGSDLRYRGYSIADIPEGTVFEEIAYLLLHARLPTSSELADFLTAIGDLTAIPPFIRTALESLPATTHPMDVLRTGVSLLGCAFPDDPKKPLATAYRLLATLPAMVLIWHRHHAGQPYPDPSETTIAGRFLEGLHGAPPTAEDRALVDISLILYAEHEFNASTFAARVTTATLSDMYSAICSAIGTLKGPLHGGANEAAMHMLLPLRDAGEADAFITDALARKVKIMGFGHRVYKIRDPRSDIIKDLARRLAERLDDWRYYRISEVIERRLREAKGLFPNLDFYSASFYYLLGIPIPLYTPIFVFSRVAGWAAHVLEQRSDNRLIRPAAEYTGPDTRAWIRLKDRS